MYEFSGLLDELKLSLQPPAQAWRGVSYPDDVIDELVAAAAYEIDGVARDQNTPRTAEALRADPMSCLAMDLTPEIVADYLFERVANLNYAAVSLAFYMTDEDGAEVAFDLRDEPLYRDLRRLMNERRYSPALLRRLAKSSAAHESVLQLRSQGRPLGGASIGCVVMSVRIGEDGLELNSDA